ncbi:unnamed protein product, partial [Lymnaea stagnalis]
MSLLVTSCTMGKNPDRLLHKGAAYLRTRTNIGMFAQNRKSAVELLAASKSQFYVKSSQPLRSKSEFDLSQLQLTRVEDESDENNNDTSIESITQSENDVLEGTERLSLENRVPAKTRLEGRGDGRPEGNNTESSTLKPEMSIESADQAVYHSGINALPSAQMEADLEQGGEGDAREVTRSNSSLSGLIDQQDMSPLSLSPTPYCSTVPRSHSDISCRLESQHSRDSSLVSSHSRLSRASAGADLENFFNQMGLEKGILEPISRLKELQASEIFDSVSSLDSHDAASICSTYSRSDQEWSETQSMERSHQQTSIIERNARIIKWLCNVRKAKTPTQK